MDFLIVGLHEPVWADLGLYSAPHRMSMAVLTFGLIFQQVVFPGLARSWRDVPRGFGRRSLDGLVRVLMIGVVPVAVGATVLAGPIVRGVLHAGRRTRRRGDCCWRSASGGRSAAGAGVPVPDDADRPEPRGGRGAAAVRRRARCRSRWWRWPAAGVRPGGGVGGGVADHRGWAGGGGLSAAAWPEGPAAGVAPSPGPAPGMASLAMVPVCLLLARPDARGAGPGRGGRRRTSSCSRSIGGLKSRGCPPAARPVRPIVESRLVRSGRIC